MREGHARSSGEVACKKAFCFFVLEADQTTAIRAISTIKYQYGSSSPIRALRPFAQLTTLEFLVL